MSAILSADLVASAFAAIRPSLQAAIDSGLVGRPDVAVVVAATFMLKPWPQTPEGFAQGCYLKTSLGDLSRSAYPNMEIALKKAELSARSGRPSAHLPPHYLLAGDCVFWGSAVLDGIVVACAGLEERHDEMFSYWIAAAVQAAARGEFDRRRAAAPQASFLD